MIPRAKDGISSYLRGGLLGQLIRIDITHEENNKNLTQPAPWEPPFGLDPLPYSEARSLSDS